MDDTFDHVSILRIGFEKLQQYLPLITVECTDGEIETKTLSLFNDNESLLMLFDESIIDRDDPKVLDVSDLGIRTKHMTRILKFLIYPESFSFRNDEGIFDPYLDPESMVLAIVFLDKFLFTDHLAKLLKQMEYRYVGCTCSGDRKLIVPLTIQMKAHGIRGELYKKLLKKSRGRRS
uniref:Uncharacterized protein n=1 Tax=Pithovirus LCPAC304 TaxID=2506594 RepID=A0A481ZAF8_9VIRU|nr:MAG: hypothetical protein LCPAC304_04260 [Pithovirus LCPAC304]